MQRTIENSVHIFNQNELCGPKPKFPMVVFYDLNAPDKTFSGWNIFGAEAIRHTIDVCRDALKEFER